MKMILYVGATLMIGASIYGFVDYKKTNNKPAFQKMYNEKEEPLTDDVVVIKPDVKEAVLTTKESEVKNLPVPPVAEEKNKARKAGKKNAMKNKKKKISYKEFSRAPLRD